jgi:cell division protein FtsI/penicillin-binding protein 2
VGGADLAPRHAGTSVPAVSSRSRLALLVGVFALAGAVYAIFTLMRDDGSDPTPDAEAYLSDWEDGDWAAMADRVDGAPASFADEHQAVVDDLRVSEARYELGSVDTDRGGDTAVAQFTATLELGGLGEWSYDGTLSLTRDGDRWLVDWSPAAMHPSLRDGRHLARTREMPVRAPILDAAGKPLAIGRPGRIIGLEPRAVTNLALVKAAFQDQLGIPPAEIDEALNAPGVQPDHFVTITTVDQARYDQVAPVIYPLPGTRFRDTFIRGGPTPEFAAHVLGRVGEATAERLDELGDPYQAGDQVGLTGLEAQFEKQLAGGPSGEIRVVGEDGKAISTVGRVSGRKPEPLATTLDPTVQAAVEAAIGDDDRPLAVVVVDKDSNVRAVASRPLGEFNRALGGSYPPGSTFKVVTAAALLGSGVTPDSPVECTPTFNAGGRDFRNFERSSLGTVPFRTAFAQSCNTAFISAAAQLPADALMTAAGQFGFNSRYTVGLDTRGGEVGSAKDDTEAAAMAIGQGTVTASPLHMATVGATTLDGSWNPPVLLPDAAEGDRPDPTTLGPGVADTLHGLMRGVVQEGSGKSAAVRGADITGKTGTAEYGQGNPPPTHAWFIGTRGDLAVAVLVEGGGVGGEVAAPLAGKVLAGLPD